MREPSIASASIRPGVVRVFVFGCGGGLAAAEPPIAASCQDDEGKVKRCFICTL